MDSTRGSASIATTPTPATAVRALTMARSTATSSRSGSAVVPTTVVTVSFPSRWSLSSFPGAPPGAGPSGRQIGTRSHRHGKRRAASGLPPNENLFYTRGPPPEFARRRSGQGGSPVPVGLWNIASEQPARPAVIDAGGAAISYGELAARANQLVHGLRAQGLRRGDVVAAVLDN